DDAGRLRADHALAKLTGPTFPRHVFGMIDALLLKERLVEVAIGAFQRPHEGAFLCPALPPFVLLLRGKFIGLVVADARSDLVIHACHGVRFPTVIDVGSCTQSLRDCRQPRNECQGASVRSPLPAASDARQGFDPRPYSAA